MAYGVQLFDSAGSVIFGTSGESNMILLENVALPTNASSGSVVVASGVDLFVSKHITSAIMAAVLKVDITGSTVSWEYRDTNGNLTSPPAGQYISIWGVAA